ncbi:MAG: phosphatidylglycerol lysyltransferase domain-containing protein [Ktedonobacteraceae bacterium]
MFNSKERLIPDLHIVEEQFASACHTEEALTRTYGDHTLAFFGLAPENLHFLAPYGEGLVNYRLTRNVAVVLGDPVCAPQAFERVTGSFLAFCARHKWQVAFYQVYPQHLNTYRALNMHAFKMGEEAILNPQSFTLQGAALANVRTSSRRAEREGVSIQWYEGVPPTEVMYQLEHLSSAWLAHKGGKHAKETAFSVGRFDELTNIAARADTLATLSTPSTVPQETELRFLTVVAMTSAGKACAFMTFTPVYGCLNDEATGNQPEVQGWGWTLDIMRRTPTTPPGVIELLLVRAIDRFRLCGATVLSLGLVAWSDTRQEMNPVQRKLASFVTDRLHLLETHNTLFKFKQKFNPCWESRYVVARTTLSLPCVALGVLRVRNYSSGMAKLVR